MMNRALTIICAAMLIAGSMQILPAQTLTDSNLVVEQVNTAGDTLSNPTVMEFLGSNDILVCEKNTGQVRRIVNGTVQAGNVLDLAVATNSERGLLGIALDPEFSSTNHVFLFYTRAATDGGTAIDQRISRFTWNGSALTSELVVLTLPVTTGPNHNGGIILFGPPTAAPADQKLFAVIGDLNRLNQNENYAGGAAPDDTAVILRINKDGSTPSGAEAGPFFSVLGANASLQRTYAYGVRNSYGMDFDPVNGNLWDTENGPDRYDEINLVEPGMNSGWRRFMGPQANGDALIADGPPSLVDHLGTSTYSDPEFSWRSPIGITSIHFLRSTALGAAYQHDCFVGANNNGKLYHFEMNPTRDGFALSGNLADLVLTSPDSDVPILFGTGFGVTTDIKTGPDGYLYTVSYTQDRVYRIRSSATGVDDWSIYL